MEMQVLRCDCCGEIDKIGLSAGGLCQVCESGRVYPAPNAATRAAMEEARTMTAPDPRDAEIARLRERLTLAEAVCHAVWNHEQADDALMSGMQIGTAVQIWRDATQAA